MNFALNPTVLEFFLFNLDKPFNELKKLAKKEYKFLEHIAPFELVNDCPTGRWLHDGRIQNLHLSPLMINQCQDVLEMIQSVKYKYYMLNGEIVSLYVLMQSFESKKPKNIRRNKGLGEMNTKELSESTLSPTSSRALIRYTMEEAQEQIERIRYLNSDKSSLLKNIKVRAEDLD